MALIDYVHEHPIIVVGGAIVVAFIVIPKVLQAGQSQIANANGTSSTVAGSTNNTGATQDLSGLTNGVVYVPTTTTFSTTNNTTGSVVNSPNSNAINPAIDNASNTPTSATVQVITPSQTATQPRRRPMILTPPTMTTTTPVTVPPVTMPNDSTPPRQGTPVPTPAPKTGQLNWNQNYTIKAGDTLTAIATRATTAARNAGMPTSMMVTFNDIYAHNKSAIDSASQAHGMPISGGAINNIFPGEIITIPVWSK